MFPFLRVPALAGGWLAVTLSLSLSSPLQALDFPRLDESLREAFLYATASDDPTTPTLPVAHYLGHLLRHDAPLVVPEAEAAERCQSARELLAARDRWGVQALTSPVLNSIDFRTAEDYWRWLFEQFRDDNIPGNGYGATRIALLALSTAPEMVLPHLYAEWARRPRSAPLDQEGLRLAHLMLCHAYRVRDGWVEQVWQANELQLLAAPGEKALHEARARVLTTVAALVLATRSVPDHGVMLEEICQPLAYLVANSQPGFADGPIELWAAAEREHLHPNQNIFHLLAAHHRARFHEPAFLPLIIKWLGMSDDSIRWTLTGWYELTAEDLAEVENPEEDPLVPCGATRWNGETRRLFLAEVLRHRETVLAAVHAELPRADSRAALEFADFLLRLDYEPAREAAMAVAISHLADDHIRWNAGRAFDLLHSYSENLSDTDKTLLFHAGVSIGAEAKDLQLVSNLYYLAHDSGVDWSPLDSPESVAFLISQLRDDDIPDNGATAFHTLRPFSEQLRPLLRDLAANTEEDWQLRRAARLLLEGGDYLGYGEPKEVAAIGATD